jgi:hypothetical protein
MFMGAISNPRISSVKLLFSLFCESIAAVILFCKLKVYGVFVEYVFENRQHLHEMVFPGINPSTFDRIARGQKQFCTLLICSFHLPSSFIVIVLTRKKRTPQGYHLNTLYRYFRYVDKSSGGSVSRKVCT